MTRPALLLTITFPVFGRLTLDSSSLERLPQTGKVPIRRGPAEIYDELRLDEVTSRASSVGEDVCAEDVDLPPGVPEEGAEASCHQLERTFTSRAIGPPVVPRNDQEQVVGVGRDVRLPEILQIVVVGGRTAPLDLGDDPSSRAEAEEEVRSRLSHESSLRSQDHLLAEPELKLEEEREVVLDRLTPSPVDVDGGDRVASRENVLG